MPDVIPGVCSTGGEETTLPENLRPHDAEPAPGMSRRAAMLGVTGAAIGYGLVSPAAAEAPGPLTAAECDVIAAVARVGAVFPIAFPGFGEAGTALSRAGVKRVPAAAVKVKPARLAAVRAGVAQLSRAGLRAPDRENLISFVGTAGGAPGEPVPAPLLAVAALAIGTVSGRFDPNSDHAATIWIDGMRRLHTRRTAAPPAGGRRSA